ncbi:hypothetical protein LguiA_007043 [Lonicera macranthoides]
MDIRFLTSKLVSTTKSYKCSDKRSEIVAQICARCSENLEDLSEKDLLEDFCYFRLPQNGEGEKERKGFEWEIAYRRQRPLRPLHEPVLKTCETV